MVHWNYSPNLMLTQSDMQTEETLFELFDKI